MAIRRGKNLLDDIRRMIGDDTYYSFVEINQAHREILTKAPYNILRKSEIIGYGLYDDTKEYDLNIANIRSIERIWISESGTTSVGDIAGITLSGTNPVSIQVTAHGLSSGRQILPEDVGGTTELNDNTYKITVTDANNFTLNGTDSSDFTAWTSGGTVSSWDIDDGVWDLMVETTPQMYNDAHKDNTQQTANVTTGTVVTVTTEVTTNRVTTNWKYYLKGGDSSPFMKMIVTPTPQTTYKLKIDYLASPSEISENTIPDVPPHYYDMLTLLAAAKILIREPDENKVALGMKYEAQYRDKAFYLLLDLHRNRTGTTGRPACSWKC